MQNDDPIDLIITARSWSHSVWDKEFYPEDLPDDWQLSFYSNEFRAVVVPTTEWVGIDPIEVERWEEDTPEEFRFFVEVEDVLTDWEAFAALFRPLGDQLGGILLRPSRVDPDLSMLATNITSATKLAPVSLILPEGVEPNLAGMSLLKEHGVELCWHVGQGEPPWSDIMSASGVVVARVDGNMNFTARQWRETIQSCLQYCPRQRDPKQHSPTQQASRPVKNKHGLGPRLILLMVDGENPAINDLRSAMMIGDMVAMPVNL